MKMNAGILGYGYMIYFPVAQKIYQYTIIYILVGL